LLFQLGFSRSSEKDQAFASSSTASNVTATDLLSESTAVQTVEPQDTAKTDQDFNVIDTARQIPEPEF